jgi:hypothetical protein
VDLVTDILVDISVATALQQLDLHVIQRIEIGKRLPDRACRQRVALEQ